VTAGDAGFAHADPRTGGKAGEGGRQRHAQLPDPSGKDGRGGLRVGGEPAVHDVRFFAHGVA